MSQNKDQTKAKNNGEYTVAICAYGFMTIALVGLTVLYIRTDFTGGAVVSAMLATLMFFCAIAAMLGALESTLIEHIRNNKTTSKS